MQRTMLYVSRKNHHVEEVYDETRMHNMRRAASLKKLMDQPFCHMHGPEHHVMTGASLLTAYKNAGGDIDLKQALVEMTNRGKSAETIRSNMQLCSAK